MPTDPTITAEDRELAEEIEPPLQTEYPLEKIERDRRVAKNAAIIARRREKMAGRVKHCDRCGSDWADNGINSGCPCVLLAEHQKREKVLVEALRRLSETPYAVQNNETPPMYARRITRQALKEHNQ